MRLHELVIIGTSQGIFRVMNHVIFDQGIVYIMHLSMSRPTYPRWGFVGDLSPKLVPRPRG